MLFKTQNFLHAPQTPEMVQAAYFKVVEAYTPAHNPANSYVRTIEQLAKGLVYDVLTHRGDTEQGVFTDLAKAGLVSVTPQIPYVYCFLSPSKKVASLTGTYQPNVQNVLPKGIHEETSRFHQRMRFDVDFINNHTVKQVVLVELGIPYVPSLSLEDSIALFKDTFSVFVQYPELSELYNRFGYVGSQIITSVTTNPLHSWYCSAKLMLIVNSFNSEQSPEAAQAQAQEFADEFTNLWVNAVAHVANITTKEDVSTLADNIASNYVNFVFHANAKNIEDVTPDVNVQMLYLEDYLAKHTDEILALTEKDIVNNCLQVPGGLSLTPSMLLRLTCIEGLNIEVHRWCVSRWLEFCQNFAGTLSNFLSDHYYQDVLEYNPEDCMGQISQARQDYFFNLNKTNDNELLFKIPTNLAYTTIAPLVMENTILLLAESQPRALNFILQLLLDLHNNAFSLLVNQEELEKNGSVGLYMPVEWLLLCADISDYFNELAVILSLQDQFDPEDEKIIEILGRIEDHVNNWLSQDFYRVLVSSGLAYLSPRRLTLGRTWVDYQKFYYEEDILVSDKEAGRPSALLTANIINEAFAYPSNEDMKAIFDERVANGEDLKVVENDVMLETPVSPVHDALYHPFEFMTLKRLTDKLFDYSNELKQAREQNKEQA